MPTDNRPTTCSGFHDNDVPATDIPSIKERSNTARVFASIRGRTIFGEEHHINQSEQAAILFGVQYWKHDPHLECCEECMLQTTALQRKLIEILQTSDLKAKSGYISTTIHAAIANLMKSEKQVQEAAAKAAQTLNKKDTEPTDTVLEELESFLLTYLEILSILLPDPFRLPKAQMIAAVEEGINPEGRIMDTVQAAFNARVEQRIHKIETQSITLMERVACLTSYARRIPVNFDPSTPRPLTRMDSRRYRTEEIITERMQRIHNKRLHEHIKNLENLTRRERETVVLAWLEAVETINEDAADPYRIDVRNLKQTVISYFSHFQDILLPHDNTDEVDGHKNTRGKSHSPNLKTLPNGVVETITKEVKKRQLDGNTTTVFYAENIYCKNDKGNNIHLKYLSVIRMPNKGSTWITVEWKAKDKEKTNKKNKIQFTTEAEFLLSLGVS
jgi:hypothetical protein